MTFTFIKTLTGDIPQLFLKAKAEARRANGLITGNEQSGEFSGKTPVGSIIGTYTVVDSVITVTISKKPLLVPESAIKDALTGYFS